MRPHARPALEPAPLPDSVPLGEDLRSDLFSAHGLEILYRSQAARLIRRFTRRVDYDEARDAVHDAFVRLAGSRFQDGGGIDCPDAYLATVATNALRDRARVAARRALSQSRLAQDPAATALDPHRVFEGREALRAIERALEDMNPRRRRIFMLHRFEQMTYAEVGREVGMSEKGVKKQIAKALVELRRAVERPA